MQGDWAAMGSDHCCWLHFHDDMRRPLETLKSRMIKARVLLQLIGGNRHYCAHMAGPPPPHMQVDNLVAAVFNGVTHALRHARVRLMSSRIQPVSRISPYEQFQSSVRGRPQH